MRFILQCLGILTFGSYSLMALAVSADCNEEVAKAVKSCLARLDGAKVASGTVATDGNVVSQGVALSSAARDISGQIEAASQACASEDLQNCVAACNSAMTGAQRQSNTALMQQIKAKASNCTNSIQSLQDNAKQAQANYQASAEASRNTSKAVCSSSDCEANVDKVVDVYTLVGRDANGAIVPGAVRPYVMGPNVGTVTKQIQLQHEGVVTVQPVLNVYDY